MPHALKSESVVDFPVVVANCVASTVQARGSPDASSASYPLAVPEYSFPEYETVWLFVTVPYSSITVSRGLMFHMETTFSMYVPGTVVLSILLSEYPRDVWAVIMPNWL